VIRLLVRGLEEELTRRGGLRNEGLAVVQRLGRYFPGVVYAHEGGGEAPVEVGQLGRLLRRGCRSRGHGPDGPRRGEQGAEGPVGGRQKAI
jgi:hypothetical protein